MHESLILVRNLRSVNFDAAETWPFLIELLMKCVLLEISSSKKRPPKLTFAKTLRIVVQRAEDSRFSGWLFGWLSLKQDGDFLMLYAQ